MKTTAKNRLYPLLLFVLATGVHNIHAQDFTSGPERTDLFELYTSEGCSSCPPADRQLNELEKNEDLWSEFVPIAFHVDYWNYIGWIDPYSKPQFSDRQRRYSKEWRARTIYTPCFVVNGVARRVLEYGNSNQHPGVLKASISNDRVTVVFTSVENTKEEVTAWLAPLSGLETSSVTAGENRGLQLEHRFVALGLASGNMTVSDDTYTIKFDMPQDSRTKALAIWISTGDSLKPLQATGGWIKP